MKTFSGFFDDLREIVNKGLARKTDPETSKEAGASIDTTNLEKIVLEAIKAFPDGCILQDIEHTIPHIRQSSISPRIRPLIRKGLIYATGEYRPSYSGRSQRVLKVIK
mgnify:FL=1